MFCIREELEFPQLHLDQAVDKSGRRLILNLRSFHKELRDQDHTNLQVDVFRLSTIYDEYSRFARFALSTVNTLQPTKIRLQP